MNPKIMNITELDNVLKFTLADTDVSIFIN